MESIYVKRKWKNKLQRDPFAFGKGSLCGPDYSAFVVLIFFLR